MLTFLWWAVFHVQIVQGSINSVFQENQVEEECGIFSSTVHQNHNTSSHETVAINNAQKNTEDHLHMDKVVADIKWPWQAVIKSNGEYKCNGVLIKNQWVLTTATCVDGNNLNTEVQINNMTYKPLSFHPHDGFDNTRKKKMAGDIALIKLTAPVPVETKRNVAPICAPRSRTQLKQTTECAVTYMAEEGKGEIKTYSAASKVLNMKRCSKNDAFKIDGSRNMLLCIGTTTEMKSACEKAPVMFFFCKSSGFWSIFGISKFCNLSKTRENNYSYSYFLQIVSYLSWIKETTKETKKQLSNVKNVDD